jgi:hypothetical protein
VSSRRRVVRRRFPPPAGGLRACAACWPGPRHRAASRRPPCRYTTWGKQLTRSEPCKWCFCGAGAEAPPPGACACTFRARHGRQLHSVAAALPPPLSITFYTNPPVAILMQPFPPSPRCRGCRTSPSHVSAQARPPPPRCSTHAPLHSALGTGLRRPPPSTHATHVRSPCCPELSLPRRPRHSPDRLQPQVFPSSRSRTGLRGASVERRIIPPRHRSFARRS